MGVRKRFGSLLGPQGQTPQIETGTTATGAYGTPAKATMVKTGTASYRLDMTIPEGKGGPTAVPTDNAISAFIASPSATRTALDNVLAPAVSSGAGNAIVTGLADGGVIRTAGDARYASKTETDTRLSVLTPSTPERFGAMADGTTDDTAAIRAAWDEAATFGRPLVLQGGKTYRVTSQLNFSGQSVEIIGTGPKPAVIYAPGQSFDAVRIDGNPTEQTKNLAASQQIGTYEWTLDNTAGIEPGMLMAVKSSKSWYFDPRPDRTDARKSEMHLVERVAGNVVWTQAPANDGYDLAKETVELAFSRPIRVHLDNLLIRGVKQPVGPEVAGQIGLRVTGALEPLIERVSVEDFQYMGMLVTGCYNGLIDGGHVAGSNGIDTGYGVQLSGCTFTRVRGMLFSGGRRGADVSGGQIISLHCTIEACTALGGGVRSDGLRYGYRLGFVEAENYGFGSHGPADHTTYDSCVTINLQRPYMLRGGNERIINAKHWGRTAGGVIHLMYGENLHVDGMRVYDYSSGVGREDASLDGGSNSGYRRPVSVIHVGRGYNATTSHVSVSNVDAQVTDAFVKFESGALFTLRALFSNIRTTFLTGSSADECAVFMHLGTSTVATGNRWAINAITYYRENNPSNAGEVSLTKRVNIAGAQYIPYTSASATT